MGIVGAVIMPHNMYLHSALVKVSKTFLISVACVVSPGGRDRQPCARGKTAKRWTHLGWKKMKKIAWGKRDDVLVLGELW